MINWILSELEKQPSRLFYEKELVDKDTSEFIRLKDERLLTYVHPDEHYETYGLNQRVPLTVKKIGDKYWAFAEDDPEADPIPVKKSDLSKYAFRLDVFASRLQKVNNLSGSPFQMDRRLFFLGEKVINSEKIAFVLGLFDSDREVEHLLLGLPVRLPHRVEHVAVITPTYQVGSANIISELRGIGIQIFPYSLTDDWRVDPAGLVREKPPGLPIVRITAQQEKDYEKYGYNCKLPIHVTGKVAESNNNVVEVGDSLVEMGDTPFRLFLRLVLELKRNKEGAVTKTDLRSEGYLSEDSEFQSVGRLRNCFIRALGDLDPKKLVEVYRPKSLRLSIHPEIITVDMAKLSAHDDARVRELAQQLGALPVSSSKISNPGT